MSNLLSYFRLVYCEKIMNIKKEIQFYAVLIKRLYIAGFYLII